MNKLDVVDEFKLYVLADDYAGYNSIFWAQHGVSYLIEVKYNGKKKRLLFDTGSYAEPILYNMKLLDLDPRRIDIVILSHSHFDHTGGLLGIIKEVDKEIPIIAHPEIFKKSFAMEPEFIYAGIPPLRGGTKESIERQGGILILTRDPVRLAPGVIVLGEIGPDERYDFEKQSTSLYKIDGERIVPDTVNDEISLAVNTGKGLVVITGCSHPGVASIVNKAVTLTNIEKVYAVIGGFHLINASKQRIIQTIEKLKELGVEKIYTGHCTGLRAEALFLEEYGSNFEKLHAGKIITI